MFSTNMEWCQKHSTVSILTNLLNRILISLDSFQTQIYKMVKRIKFTLKEKTTTTNNLKINKTTLSTQSRIKNYWTNKTHPSNWTYKLWTHLMTSTRTHPMALQKRTWTNSHPKSHGRLRNTTMKRQCTGRKWVKCLNSPKKISSQTMWPSTMTTEYWKSRSSPT